MQSAQDSHHILGRLGKTGSMLIILVGGKCSEAGIFNGSSNCKVIQALIAKTFNAEDLTHGIIEEASDSRTADAADLCLKV